MLLEADFLYHGEGANAERYLYKMHSTVKMDAPTTAVEHFVRLLPLSSEAPLREKNTATRTHNPKKNTHTDTLNRAQKTNKHKQNMEKKRQNEIQTNIGARRPPPGQSEPFFYQNVVLLRGAIVDRTKYC